MKKTLITLLAFVLVATLAIGLASCSGADSCEHTDKNADNICEKCGEIIEEEHVHAYILEVADHKYLAASASCTSAAQYFKSCSCGAVGDETFNSGSPLPHSYTEENTDTEFLSASANCENAAKYCYSCTCGAKGTDTFLVGYPNGHSFIDGVCSSCASEGTPGLVYELSGSNYTVVGTKTGGEMQIVIPSTYKGNPVVAVADGAFSDCKNLLSVEIGKNVTEISSSAFDGCDKLTELIYRADAYSGPTPETVMETHSLETKIRRVGDFWFYTVSDTTSYLIHYSGKSSAVTLPDEYIVDETVRFILPTVITASDFENTLLLPLVEKFAALLEKYCRADNPNADFSFIGNENYEAYEYGCIKSNAFLTYMKDMQLIFRYTLRVSSEGYKEINVLYGDIIRFFAAYTLKNPQKYVNSDSPTSERTLQAMYEVYPITKSGLAIYVYASSDLPATKDSLSAIVTKYFPEYNYETLIEQETRAGAVHGNYKVDSRFFIGSIATDITVPSDKSDFSIISLSECDQLIKIHLKKGAQWDPTRISEAKHFSNAKCVIEFTVESDHEDYISIDGNLYSKDGKTLIQYAIGKTDKNFSIPAGVNTIGAFSFLGCEALTSVIIPDSVTSIGLAAFAYCTGLESVTIPDSVTSIDSSAFGGCEKLADVTMGKGVTSIGERAFSDCSSLASVYITDIEAWCEISFADMFYYPNNSLLENDISLYLNDNLVTDIIIPNGATSIGPGAFSGYSKLKSVTIPNSVTSIGLGAFAGCENLTDVTIGTGVIAIERFAFRDCSSLTGVYITDITAWCKISFDGVESNPLYYAENLYLNGNSVTDIIILDSVTSIGSYAFYDYDSLESVTIGNNVKLIGKNAFSGCNSLESVTIGNSVTSIGESAFSGCTSLAGVTIPDSVNSIGDYAFGNCSSLASVTIGNSVTSIGESAFSGCNSLENVTIGNSVTTIGDCAFDNCSSLMSVTIPNSVTSIGLGAFASCENLADVTIGNGVTLIGYDAFDNCASLRCVYITDIKAWCEITFENIYANPLSMGAVLYLNGNLLTDIVIPDSVTSIGICAFLNCIELNNVKFENPNGWWYASDPDATSGTEISCDDLQNSSTAAIYLTSTYRYYYWKRS